MISAPYLDKSKTKRHASVFTKFHAFCLPYERVLLLDVDLLPRHGTDLGALFAVAAPAGKYHCARYRGPQPHHNSCIPDELKKHWWCPNAGVLRVDPLPTRAERETQLVHMITEMIDWDHPSFLPEQYFLAQFFKSWRHIGPSWNYEVWFEWDVPKKSANLEDAAEESKQHGWSLYTGSDSEHVQREALVWHFSGTVDTQPWMFLDIPSVEAVREFASKVWFAARDPGGILAAAVAEWREALDELLSSEPSGGELCALQRAVEILASQAAIRRRRRFKDSPWWCDACGEERCNVEWVCPDFAAALGEPLLVCACAECLVWRLRLAVCFSNPNGNGSVGKRLGGASKILAVDGTSSLAGKLRASPYGARKILKNGMRNTSPV
jgi:lipopolysaccharide biosynthesis glycosyltransferase